MLLTADKNEKLWTSHINVESTKKLKVEFKLQRLEAQPEYVQIGVMQIDNVSLMFFKGTFTIFSPNVKIQDAFFNDFIPTPSMGITVGTRETACPTSIRSQHGQNWNRMLLFDLDGSAPIHEPKPSLSAEIREDVRLWLTRSKVVNVLCHRRTTQFNVVRFTAVHGPA